MCIRTPAACLHIWGKVKYNKASPLGIKYKIEHWKHVALRPFSSMLQDPRSIVLESQEVGSKLTHENYNSIEFGMPNKMNLSVLSYFESTLAGKFFANRGKARQAHCRLKEKGMSKSQI